jgi:hypothetical protein
MTLANENCMNEGVKRNVNSGNACYHSVQSLWSSAFLSKNIRIEVNRAVFPVSVLWVWSLVLHIKGRTEAEGVRNKVLGNIVGPKSEEVVWDWRKLNYEKPHHVYVLPDITQVIKSMGMRWAGHVACMEEEECMQGFSGETWRKGATWKT